MLLRRILATENCALVFPVIFISVVVFTHGPVSADEIEVGNAKIVVAAPNGMVRLDGKNKKYDRMAKKFLSGTNDLLAMYGTPTDLEEVSKGGLPSQRTFSVQTRHGMDNVTWPLSEFQSMKTMIKNEVSGQDGALSLQAETEIRKAVKSGQRQLQKETGVPMEIELGPLTELGVFDETPESVSFTTLMSADIAEPTVTREDSSAHRGVVASTLILARNKVIYLYAVSEYRGEKDLQWAKTALSQWRDGVIATNPNTNIVSTAQRRAADTAVKSFFTWAVAVPVLIFAIYFVKGFLGKDQEPKPDASKNQSDSV